METNPFCAPFVAEACKHLSSSACRMNYDGELGPQAAVCLASLASCIYPVRGSLGNPKAFVDQTAAW